MMFSGRFILWQYDFAKPVKDRSGENSGRKEERQETMNNAMAEVRALTATLETPLAVQGLRLCAPSADSIASQETGS